MESAGIKARLPFRRVDCIKAVSLSVPGKVEFHRFLPPKFTPGSGGSIPAWKA